MQALGLAWGRPRACLRPYSLLQAAVPSVPYSWLAVARQGDLDPEYRRLNQERSAKAAAKTRTMQVIADPRDGQMRPQHRVGQRISFSNKVRSPLSSIPLPPNVHLASSQVGLAPKCDAAFG